MVSLHILSLDGVKLISRMSRAQMGKKKAWTKGFGVAFLVWVLTFDSNKSFVL